MEDILKTNVSETDKDALYTIVLYLLSLQQQIKIDKEWSAFSKEIKEKSRFFPNNTAVLQRIDRYKDIATDTLRVGDCFFRARIYNPFDEKLIKLNEMVAQMLSSESPCEDFLSETMQFPASALFVSIKLLVDAEHGKFKNTYEDWRKEYQPFLGYNERASDAPPSDIVTEGRANPRHISYLYAASDVNTAISEIRPMNGQIVSVATIEIQKELKIYGFDKKRIWDDTHDFADQIELSYIAELFSCRVTVMKPSTFQHNIYVITYVLWDMTVSDMIALYVPVGTTLLYSIHRLRITIFTRTTKLLIPNYMKPIAI